MRSRMTDSPRATVIVPTTGRRPVLLGGLLRALIGQDGAGDTFEVIVVGDGARDPLESLPASEFDFPLRTIVHGTNRGRAAACNTGLNAARGELVLFLDDDMEPVRGWLHAHANAHDRDSVAGVIGAAPISREQSGNPVGDYFRRRFDRHLAKLSTQTSIGYRDVYTGNFSIPRVALEAVDGFDEDFTIYGNEDGDLAIRLLASGVDLVYEPAAMAAQHYDKDLRQAFADALAKGRTATYLALKHPAAAGELRLSKPGSPRRRIVRSTMLTLARLAPFTPKLILSVAAALERRSALARSDRWYDWLLDYGYWLGVTSARREH